MGGNPETGLRVGVLGPLRAWRGEAEIGLGPARQRAIFAVLAVHAGRPVPRGELIDAVWGESPPASVEGSVHTYVSGLRRALEPGRSRWSAASVLVSEAAGYTLLLEPDALDSAVFEQHRDRGRKYREEGDPRAAVAEFDAALALWQGEALSGVPGGFAERHRERLGELRLDTLERRAEALLALGRHLDVGAELAVLATEHPLRESLRESLMLALYRSGRPAEALDVFRDARATLTAELGVEPGPALQRLHQRILAQDPALDTPVPPGARLFGREAETARLAELLADVRAGRGRAVWIEGGPGLGKSELLTRSLPDGPGHRLSRAAADELSMRFPLQVMLECLAIDVRSPDPRRARVAKDLAGDGPARRSWDAGDPVLAAVDRLLALVDELCADQPQVLVLDDLQWADEASVLVWHRLCAATRQLPLLLVAATRPAPDRAELAQLRRGVLARDGVVFDLAPLTGEDVGRLIEDRIGAPPGPGLRELAARGAGNPLYVKEMVDVLQRAGAVEVRAGEAEVADPAEFDAPGSLVAAVDRRLDFLPEGTQEVLRRCALLGMEFAVGDIAAVLGERPSDLLQPLEEAMAGNVLVDTGTQLAFRHPLLRQALYDRLPAGERASLHRQAAEALARIGAPVKRVAEQLAASSSTVDEWVLGWLTEHHSTMSNRAPLIAVELLERALAACPAGDPRRPVLLAALVKVLFRLERDPETLARQAFEAATEPEAVEEMRHILAALRHRRGDTEGAVAILTGPVDDPAVPALWRVRHRYLLANFRRGDLSDLDATETAAYEGMALAGGDKYLTAHALQTLWLVDSVRRDHESALARVDAAIEAVGDDRELADVHLDLLDNRVFTLQNLDRLADAGESLRAAAEVAVRHSMPLGLQVSVAVHRYWEGRWDEALVELDTVTEDGPAITFYGLREPGAAALLLHGVAALIAGRRDERAQAAAHLDAAEEYAPATGAERESFDFLLVADALAAEQRGDRGRALAVLEPILDPAYARMMLRHQWLPAYVRLAKEQGDEERARRALKVCEEEAAKERRPARAHAAASWCRGLIEEDPRPVLATAEHFREVGRRPELATALEDAAVLLARAGRLDAAQAAFEEAAELYTALSARWDLRRAESRLRRLGVRRGALFAPARPGHGWASLTPIEARIATLVAEGRSNPEIAAELSVPRRTVQAHVTRLLGKLETTSRSGVAEAFQHRT